MDDGFEHLKSNITKRLDFDCSLYTDSFLHRRIEVRLRSLGVDGFIHYSNLLDTDLEERKKLYKELTIHTTNFFRDFSMWELFKDKIIPELIKKKRLAGEKSVKIWSAGSSTGEEAISIAISFFEALGHNLNGFKVEIIGTDLDNSTVLNAKEGIYDEYQFREMPQRYKDEYFIKEEDEKYAVSKNVMDLISFEEGNIVSGRKPRYCDIIFCRNTVIYFDIATKSRLYVDIFNALKPGGYFVMGKTEILQGDARNMFKIYSTEQRVYLKE